MRAKKQSLLLPGKNEKPPFLVGQFGRFTESWLVRSGVPALMSDKTVP